MKFDGHVKLTMEALRIVGLNCPDPRSCRSPILARSIARIWLGHSEKSTSFDNYSAAVVNYLGHMLTPDAVFQVTLPDAVAFVDLDEMWTHDDPKGQKYHFMKADGQTDAQGYENACRFIFHHANQWVISAQKEMKRLAQLRLNARGVSRTSPKAELIASQVRELALALHSLQDSFSPGHTRRSYGTDAPGVCRPGYTDFAAPVRQLHVYSKQNHDEHAAHDYWSGSTKSPEGRVAIGASAALIGIGILSIASASEGLQGWEAFKRQWLSALF